MLNLLFALTMTALDVGGIPNFPTIEIDPFNLAWWQQLALLLAGLGLSPAPWILGLAIGRIQFTKVAADAHQRELDARAEAHKRELETLRAHHDDLMALQIQRYADQEKATEIQRVRADTATEALAQSTVAIEASNHIIREIMKAAGEVTADGEDGRPDSE